MATGPRKRFSLHGLRLRFRSTSSVDVPPLPGSNEPNTTGSRPSTRRTVTEPAESHQDDTQRSSRRSVTLDKTPLSVPANATAVLSEAAQLRDSPSPDMPIPHPTEPETSSVEMPTPHLADVSEVPVASVPESASDVHMPTPEVGYGETPGMQIPTPAMPIAPAMPPSQFLNVKAEMPPVNYNDGTSGPGVDQSHEPDAVDGLAEVANKVHDGKPESSKKDRALGDKALGTVENTVGSLTGTVALVQQVIQPIAGVLEASGAVEAIKSGLNSFMEDIPWLMKSLDEVAKIHPVVTAAVLAFKAVYTMEMTRRNNDKRIISLYVSMKDMISVLVQLRKIKDKDDIGPDGRTIEARMQSLSEGTATDIKACANVCDTYSKKRLLVKVLKGQVWEAKLVEWIEKFTKRKAEFEFALTMHTARAVDSVKVTVESMEVKLDGLTMRLMEMFEQLTPANELELAQKVKEKGGAQVVRDNDLYLRELYEFETSNTDEKKHTSKSDSTENEVGFKPQAANPRSSARSSSSYTIHDLKDELHEDWDTAVSNNLQVFEGKFALQQRQLQEELSKFIHEENNRILDAVSKGPHDLIKHEELKEIWREMGWRRNVKARLFVMTLRDNFSDVQTRQAAAAEDEAAEKDGKDAQRTDDWAFEYISITYLQPIMEAFDDDGSGYITIFEVNRFVDALPPSIKWSLPHWIAYWAIGWQQTCANYCKKILDIFGHMHIMKSTVLPENRDLVEYYLSKVWQVGIELTISLRKPESLPDWLETKFEEYVKYEEERIKKNLKDVRYDIDALDTVYIVAGPGRIEKYIYPMLYLLLKRDINIVEAAKTKVLHKDELWDSADSILWVYDAIWQRHKDLKALFTQQKLDVEKQMGVFACEMFEYYNDIKTLFGMSNLATRSYDEPTTEPPLEWDDSISLLNYPIQDQHPFRCEIYDQEPEEPNELDSQAVAPLKDILGEWNGFIYNDEAYPLYYMTSFYAHASTQDGQDFESSGPFHNNAYTMTGKYDQDCDGIISVTFVIRYVQEYDTKYFAGHILPDGSLVGTQGWDENWSEHPNRFILKRMPAENMCHRPSPSEFRKNKPRALWKFATRAVRAQVLQRMWSWKHFAERRDVRNNYIELDMRVSHYGRPLDDTEVQTRRQARQAMTIRDSSFYSSIYDHLYRIMPSHAGFSCDACSYSLGGSRMFCITCQPEKGPYYRTVDFCGDPRCFGATIPVEQRHDLEKPHIPEHDFVKIRSVLQYRDQPDLDRRAKKALKACRTHFAHGDESESKSQSEQGGHNAPAHAEVLQVNRASQVAEGQENPSDTLAESTTESSSDATTNNDEKGIEKTTVTSDVRKKAQDHEGPSAQHDKASDVGSSASTLATQNPVCNICKKHVEQPCWFCIDCYDRDVDFFICEDCENQTLLRCTHCEQPYKQSSWYYGCRADENFLCNKCKVKGIESPVTSKNEQHTYLHALVRCKPLYVPSDTVPTEERIMTLEGKVGELDGKISRLENHLVRMESTLGLLLSKLEGSLRRPA